MFTIKLNSLEEEFHRVKNTIEYIPFFLENYGIVKGVLPKNSDGSEPKFLTGMKEKILSQIKEKSPSKKIGVGKIIDSEKEKYLEEFKNYYYPSILENFKNSIEEDIKNCSKIVNIGKIFEILSMNWGFRVCGNY